MLALDTQPLKAGVAARGGASLRTQDVEMDGSLQGLPSAAMGSNQLPCGLPNLVADGW
jgi:hypothetical protein